MGVLDPFKTILHGLAVLVLLSLLSACGGGESAPSDFDQDTQMQARAPLQNQPMQSTAAAQASQVCQTDTYPTQSEWDTQQQLQQPQPATSGTPLIKQIRQGRVIATYTKLGVPGCYQPENNFIQPDTSCGAFSRGFGRNWQAGDVFEIYPAVYEGLDQQPWIGPAYATHAEYNAQQPTIPQNITIRGITINGQRPVLRLGTAGTGYNTLNQGLVYFDRSENITLENVDIDGANLPNVGKAGVYIVAAHNLRLLDMRVHSFKQAKANGIFAAVHNQGTLEIGRVILFDNGDDSGPSHNVYINASQDDPQFTVWLHGSYSTSAVYGHTFKSRAQVNLIEGNYFRGVLPQDDSHAEAYLIDLPNGGRALVRNNVLVKNASGVDSNGAFVTYAVEGIVDTRPMSLVIEHNTFVAFAHTYDGQHELYPIFTPYQQANGERFPFPKVSVNSNVFVGFCGTGPLLGYRGQAGLLADFSDLNPNWSLKEQILSQNPLILGRPSYRHIAQTERPRTTAVMGALDN